MTRRDRLERIASAERDRRAGRVDLALAVLGEGREWPARVILALAKLDPREGAQTRAILERSLDDWAADSGLAPLSVAVDTGSRSEAADEPSEGADPVLASSFATSLGGLDAPIEHDELERAFAEAEAQVEEMHDANRVAERVLMSEPTELGEALDAPPPVPAAEDFVPDGLDAGDEFEAADRFDGADEFEAADRFDVGDEFDAVDRFDVAVDFDRATDSASVTDAAWAAPSIWPERVPASPVDADAQAVGRPGEDPGQGAGTDDGRPSHSTILATLERWLGNLEQSRARGTR